MSSSNPPFRQPPKPDPIDAMLEQWREIKAESKDKHQPTALSQLELMLLLMKRP
jgi:hypothetical protein